MSFEPIVVDMEIEEIPEVVDMELAEEINVTIIQGTDVSDTTAVESDVKTGKVFYKASGDRAVGTFSESTEAPLKDVNFFDYDGTCLYSYTASEFAELSALPDNPSHDGLTAQGWNWALADAKTYVSTYKQLIIGQMYTTSDGKTRFYIRLKKGRTSPVLGIAVNGSVTVDWGHGSSTETITGSNNTTVIYTPHSYPDRDGDYVISVDVISGKFYANGAANGSYILGRQSATLLQNRIYLDAIYKVEIGSNFMFGSYSFVNCFNLETITIPSGISCGISGTFIGCQKLKFITISTGGYTISNLVASCYSLIGMSISKNITTIGGPFNNCYNLLYVTLPTANEIGQNAFRYCYSIQSVRIPETVTSIGKEAFNACYSLASVTVPAAVATIAESAFQNCYGLGEIHFKSSTPPTVANSNAWTNIPTDCKIYVPTGKLSAYTGATNYPDSSTYTYVEE